MKNKSIKLFTMMIFLVALLLSLSGCKSCSRTQWKQVYDVYTQKEGKFYFYNFNATVTEETFADIKIKIKKKIDPVDYPESDKEYYEKYYRPSLYFVDESLEILEGNGFFNDINEDTVITFTINNFIGWDGWGYPVFGVEIDGKTYLDFETGYDNVLNYVKDQIIKYS